MSKPISAGITMSKNTSMGGGIFKNAVVTPDIHTNHIRTTHKTHRNSPGKSWHSFLPSQFLNKGTVLSTTAKDRDYHPTATPVVEPQVYARVRDLIRLAPTSNNELADE